MKFLFEFFPILLFFAAYKLGDIYIATTIAIAASFIQVLVIRLRTGRFETVPVVTLISLVVLGGATLSFRNELFIKWKPTVVYWLLAFGFLLSQWIGSGKPAIQRLAEKSIQLPDRAWLRLNISWVIFFAFLGVLNIYVLKNYDTDTWVNFKLFGTLGLTFLFIIGQSIYMIRHRLPEGNEH